MSYIYVESIIKTHDGHVFSFMSLWLLSRFVIPNIQAHFLSNRVTPKQRELLILKHRQGLTEQKNYQLTL